MVPVLVGSSRSSTAACMIAIIEAAGEDGQHYYFAGLMLSAIGCCTCPGLRFRAATGVTLAIFFAYEATSGSASSPRDRAEQLDVPGDGRAAGDQHLVHAGAAAAVRLPPALGHPRAVGGLRRGDPEVERASRTDPLTGLYNRRHFFGEAEAASGRIVGDHPRR